jgi:hypothetical protein
VSSFDSRRDLREERAFEFVRSMVIVDGIPRFPNEGGCLVIGSATTVEVYGQPSFPVLIGSATSVTVGKTPPPVPSPPALPKDRAEVLVIEP